MSHDWLEGTPAKIKNVALSTLEERFAKVVDEIVSGEGKTRARIMRLDFSPGIDGKVEMSLVFERHLDVEQIFENAKDGQKTT